MRSRVQWSPLSDRSTPTRRRASGLTAVALIALGAAVAQSFGRFTFGVLLPAIKGDLGLSNGTAGTLATVNVAAYLIGTLIVATATGRYRLLTVLRVGFVLSTLGLLLTAVTPGPLVLGVALFLSGLGGAFIWIPSPVIAADAMPPEKRSLAIGLMGSGIGLGVVFSGQLASYVRGNLGDAEWRTVYVVEAGIAIFALLAILAVIGHDQDTPTAQGGLGGFSTLRQLEGWLPLTLAYTSFGMMYLLVIAYLTSRLEEDSGWSSTDASLAFTLLGVAMVFGGPTFIMVANRVGPRRSLMIAFTGWGVLAIVVLSGIFAPTLLASIGLGLLFSAIPSLITLYVVSKTTPTTYGASYAAATLAFGIAQTASPQIGGIIAEYAGSFTPVFLLSTAFALGGLAAAYRLPRLNPAEQPS